MQHISDIRNSFGEYLSGVSVWFVRVVRRRKSDINININISHHHCAPDASIVADFAVQVTSSSQLT